MFDIAVKNQGQPKVIIWRISVVLEYQMLPIKFQGHQSIASREEDFKGLTWTWRLCWSCDLEPLKNFLFPQPQEALYDIWLQLAKWLL